MRALSHVRAVCWVVSCVGGQWNTIPVRSNFMVLFDWILISVPTFVGVITALVFRFGADTISIALLVSTVLLSFGRLPDCAQTQRYDFASCCCCPCNLFANQFCHNRPMPHSVSTLPSDRPPLRYNCEWCRCLEADCSDEPRDWLGTTYG